MVEPVVIKGGRLSRSYDAALILLTGFLCASAISVGTPLAWTFGISSTLVSLYFLWRCVSARVRITSNQVQIHGLLRTRSYDRGAVTRIGVEDNRRSFLPSRVPVLWMSDGSRVDLLIFAAYRLGGEPRLQRVAQELKVALGVTD